MSFRDRVESDKKLFVTLLQFFQVQRIKFLARFFVNKTFDAIFGVPAKPRLITAETETAVCKVGKFVGVKTLTPFEAFYFGNA